MRNTFISGRAWAGALASGVCLAATLTACADSTDGDSSCPLVLQFDGQDYQDAPASGDPPGARKVGTGEIPGCADSTDQSVDNESTEVWALKGVDPAVAVGAMLGGQLRLFVSSDADDICAVKYTLCK